ncbi:MAG: L-serine ammonia-lyase [Proteobacteria bacterium]|nr:L-serine ammonia-lyase [Pseudomonadota bacterium]NOG59572.1 L-serine ammonia-lyase [Pseudomonadota bacterium]
MTISLFELFKIGIGPSSSHTVGPMIAARKFVCRLSDNGSLKNTTSILIETYGSLALTGIGHAVDKAILLGLSGEQAHLVDPEVADAIVSNISEKNELDLLAIKKIKFNKNSDLKFNRKKRLPFHSNGMKYTAFDNDKRVIEEGIYYSIGGGFVMSQEEADSYGSSTAMAARSIPYPFKSGRELLELCRNTDLRIPGLVLANERALHITDDIHGGIKRIWDTMEACIDRGCKSDGILSGQLKVPRRAGLLFEKLSSRGERALIEPMAVMDWINLWAIAVNEENASGGRVVTAPTNGAAGIIPAVLRYYDRFCHGSNIQGVYTFFLTATAIGTLYKENASLSAAEVGCQGEVGVACSMAAAGLTAAMGGTNEQIENAAEIGMEHNLGLTCDPIGGLVQIPCIERNAIGATKAINASRIAICGDGSHKVSLDKVIATMRQTGLDMQSKYKETSRGGLAVNVVDC